MEVINMRKASKDYSDCAQVMVPIPEDLHIELKVYCTRHGLTMKEVLHEIMTDSIPNICKE